MPQDTLFGADPEWDGMPEFTRESRAPVRRLVVNFETVEDHAEFGRLMGQSLTRYTDNIWYPEMPRNRLEGVKRYAAANKSRPKHPIFIVSKGRADRCLTSRALHRLGVAHFVIVEESEFVDYSESLEPSASVVVLDPQYQRGYDSCDDLGLTKGPGPGPARNFAWDHAVDSGAAWHWVMDDNISRFHRLNRNLKVPVADGAIFEAMEDFASRYENTSMVGPAYHGLTKQRDRLPPYVLNTRIYSCNLIRTDLPYRWRGRYNEDTDLSLRMLKDGWVTVQFNAFLQEKVMTGRMAGGNRTEFYAAEGTTGKSQMLVNLHPDVARLTWKFGRWHHEVDYSRFKLNVPRRHSGTTTRDGTDEFGMVYEERLGEEWKPA